MPVPVHGTCRLGPVRSAYRYITRTGPLAVPSYVSTTLVLFQWRAQMLLVDRRVDV
jgi:hypothetical protein